MKKPIGISIIAYILLIIPLSLFLINIPFRGVMPPDMLLVVALCVVIGHGLRKGRVWGRPLFMVLLLVVIHEHLGNNRFYDDDNPFPQIKNTDDLRTLAVYLVIAGAGYWYLYRKTSVRKYYDELKNPSPAG